MTRLSSGVRINSAREDAAGLAIANKLNYQVGGLRRASENSTHGISLIQTAEGALNEVHNMLQRMRELSVQAAHGTLTNDNRAMIQLEIDQLTAEIHSISRNTEFNRMRILNGEANRVTDNSVYSAPTGAATLSITRNIVTTLYVSHQVPPGRMNYTIEEAGRPALFQFSPTGATVPDGPGRMVFPAGNGITVNGMSFNLSGKTWEEVQYEMNEQLVYVGMSLHTGEGAFAPDPAAIPPNPGTFFIVSNLAGSDQKINVTGNLSMLGVAGTLFEDFGRDARVTTANPPGLTLDGQPVLGGLLDVNGAPIAGASLAATTRGNQVLIRGSMGEDIRMNIQVMFDPALGGFRFPGPAPAAGTTADLLITNIPAAGIHMSKDFRSFGPIMLQIGPSHNTAMSVQIPRLNSETLGLMEYVHGIQRNLIDVRPTMVVEAGGGVRQVGAERAIVITDEAIQTVSNTRARLGAYQNRLESTVRNLDVAAENTEISRSRIQDTDMAKETTKFAQYNVMFQAAMSLLGQANQRPQQIISLLQ
jgi:flagellin